MVLGGNPSRRPYPLLVIPVNRGRQRPFCQRCCEPWSIPTSPRSGPLPREERELFIAAHNGHMLAFDNLSNMPPWLSDALCRLASGGGFAVRRLYTDQDEVLFEAARPVVLNGIEEVITRPDLADRAIFLTLRRSRNAAAAGTGICGASSRYSVPESSVRCSMWSRTGLRTFREVRLDALPRMADFALWWTACETRILAGWDILARLERKSQAAAIEKSSTRIRWPLACGRSWLSVATGRAAHRTCCAPDVGLDVHRGWPENPRALAGRLRRAQTLLRTLGIEMTFSRKGDRGPASSGCTGLKRRHHRQHRRSDRSNTHREVVSFILIQSRRGKSQVPY